VVTKPNPKRPHLLSTQEGAYVSHQPDIMNHDSNVSLSCPTGEDLTPPYIRKEGLVDRTWFVGAGPVMGGVQMQFSAKHGRFSKF
jgi:hypothetical protein